MARDRTRSSEPTNGGELERVKLIEWEDFEQEVARLCSLSSAIKEAKEKKLSLQRRLQPLIQVKAESLIWPNELEEMHQKLEARNLVIESMAVRSKALAEDVRKEEERLSMEVRSLLVASTALSVANKQLQKLNESLAGKRDYVRLRSLQKILRKRQQYMISQVSSLFPINISVGPSEEQELETLPSSSTAGNCAASTPINQGSLTILGLHLSMAPFTKMSLFTNKKEVQRSASALGYVAHAVSLIASYSQVPLRYPLRMGWSRSYIKDFAPSIQPTSSDLSSSASSHPNAKPVEFPLFLEGQDTTQAAYAVFLLNKDLEQLLNYVGARSLGPRHVLANLKELIRTIQSAEFLET